MDVHDYELKAPWAHAEHADSQTQPCPTKLPMQTLYRQKEFYVRECYPKYYELVVHELFQKNMRCITVTGAPGIGKSIFYGYFFNRFQHEEDFADFTIIMASFTPMSMIMRAVAFKDGKQIGECEGSSSYDFMTSQSATAGGKVIRIYDGPPSMYPAKGAKMVCFTSPNEAWIRMVEKPNTARRLYMPLWDANEMMDAAMRMGIESVVTQAVIEDRMFHFGGVARECLELSDDYVKFRLKGVEGTIAGMDTLAELARLVQQESGGATHHRLCHHVPVPDNPWEYNAQIASRFVSDRVLEKISTSEFQERHKILDYLCGIPEAAAYRSGLFEAKAHSLLSRGGSFSIGILRDDDGVGDTKTFKCKKSRELYLFDPKTLSPDVLTANGPYHISRDHNYEFIDSFYYVNDWWPLKKKRLRIFHVTVAERHPVNGKRIVATLAKLGLLDKTVKDSKIVTLIYVVAKSDENKLSRKQKLPWDLLANSEDVGILAGVGSTEVDQLKTVDVRTVGDLRRAVETPTEQQRGFFDDGGLARYRSLLRQFDTRQKSIETMLNGIQQYVWEA